MRKLFKEDEFDKISRELMNKIYPTESLNSYFNFGVAQTFSTLTDVANQYVNGEYTKELDANNLKKIINDLIGDNIEVRQMYNRLRKDGIKTEMDRMQEML